MSAPAPRVALVAGGVRGIGRALALSLAADGWRIAACYRTSDDAAKTLEAAVRAGGGDALVGRADVSDPAAAEAFVRRVDDAWGRIDALVVAAGPYRRVSLLEETVTGWRDMLGGNLDGVFHLARAVAPGMIARRWGRILTFGVSNAERLAGQTHVTAYYVAKVGVIALTRSLARTLAPHGITVNTISPGWIDAGGLPRSELDAMVDRIPAGYLGAPADAVAVARFLLSDPARYVTGANIPVSGGWGV